MPSLNMACSHMEVGCVLKYIVALSSSHSSLSIIQHPVFGCQKHMIQLDDYRGNIGWSTSFNHKLCYCTRAILILQVCYSTENAFYLFRNPKETMN
jgi:hypothetical protein